MNFLDTKQADLVELAVLMSQEDLSLIISLKSKKTISEGDLCLCGDIILTNMRAFC